MSKKETADGSFVFSVIKLVVGTLIFLILSLLMQTWEVRRQEILDSGAFPGENLFIIIPIAIGALTFAAAVFLDGFFPVAGAILTSARENRSK